MKKQSQLEFRFLLWLKEWKIDHLFVREYRFHPDRRWRLDFYSEKYRVGVELEGGLFTYGGHSRGAGYLKNLEKYNAATAMGIRLFRYGSTNQMAEFYNDLSILLQTDKEEAHGSNNAASKTDS